MMRRFHAPGNQAGTRLPPPLPHLSGPGERRRRWSRFATDMVLPWKPSPAPVAPSLLSLR